MPPSARDADPTDPRDPAAIAPSRGVGATGVGSWPGTDVREALRVVRGELTTTAPEGVVGVPYLPELPARVRYQTCHGTGARPAAGTPRVLIPSRPRPGGRPPASSSR